MTSFNNLPVANQELRPRQAIFMEADLRPWEARMEGLMAEGARIIAFRGAGSANGIEPGAAGEINSILHNYITELTDMGQPVVLMYDGDDDVRDAPDLGSVFGGLVDSLADNELVTAMAVQTSGWYKPNAPGAALESATGNAYETYVFNRDMPAIDPSLKDRGLAHSALTQSDALVAYPNYEQVIVGPAGIITATQMHDLAKKASHRPAEMGPVRVTVLAAPINPAVDEHLQASLSSDKEEKRQRAIEKIAQRENYPYGLLCTPTGELALDPADYAGIAFHSVLIK